MIDLHRVRVIVHLQAGNWRLPLPHRTHRKPARNLEERVASIGRRGIEPARREKPNEGVTKVIYQDADGNEISFGGGPG